MSRSLLLLFLALLSIVATPSPAQGCAATPEVAAQSAFREAVPGVSSNTGAGYRVQDVQVDSVLRRAWVRVRRCDDAAAPAILVPLLAPVDGPLLMGSSLPSAPQHLVASLQMSTSAPAVLSARTSAVLPTVVMVRAGEAVRAVFNSHAIHMDLEATANQAGAEGDTIQLTLKRRTNQTPDGPEQKMRGIVRADKSVEVQP